MVNELVRQGLEWEYSGKSGLELIKADLEEEATN